MTERELPQINQEVSKADGWLDGKPLPPWLTKLVIIGGMSSFLLAFAPSEQGEDPGRDRCDSGQLSCVFNENEDGGGEGGWSITPGKGVEFDHVEAGWAVHDSGCEDINGGVIGDRFWQAVNLGYEFPGTKETVVVSDLNGKDACEMPAEDFFEAAQEGLDDGAEAAVVEEVSDEQLQEEIKEEVLVEPEAVVTAEVVKRDNKEVWGEIVTTIGDRALDTVFSPKAILKGFFFYGFCLVSIVGVAGISLLKKLLGSDSGGGGRKEPLVTGSDRHRSQHPESGVMKWINSSDDDY